MTKEEMTQAHFDALMKKEEYDVKHARLAVLWFVVVPVLVIVAYFKFV
jgi:hypothetical protein